MAQGDTEQSSKLGEKIAIREEFLHCLPITNLQSRLVVAKILSYYGERQVVYKLLQTTSHTTRAYLVNSEGLKAFLIPGIVEILKSQEINQQVEVLTKY